MKKVLIGAAALLILGYGLFALMTKTTSGQNFLLERAVQAAAGATANTYDGLNVFVCGSSSPIPAPNRAQACLAVITPEHFFIVDAGAGSNANLGLAQLPVERIDGVLITHFHSDHIAELPTFNVNAWANGHQGPLKVYGPSGIKNVVDGFNAALVHDRYYRTEHHGRNFMPEAYGLMEAVTRPLESTMSFGDMTITSFTVSHSPVAPAVGYRFDYRGRSIVITGDTVVTERLKAAVEDVDLLFSDALSTPVVDALSRAASAASRDRVAKILVDIQDYHASVESVAELTRSANVGLTALYHLVPGPRNVVMENIFRREFSDNMVLTHDNMWFTLPADSTEIAIRK